MRIGIVTNWFECGAGYVSHQYRQLLAQRHDVFVYARPRTQRNEAPIWNGEFVTWGKPCSVMAPTAMDRRDFERWIQRNRLDVVFFNEQQWWEPIEWCLAIGIPTGAYIDYYTEQTVPLFGAYDFLICNTQRHCSVFSWHKHCYYVPWGTDIELFSPHSLEPVHAGGVTFFHSCGLSPLRKGTDFVLEAFARMQHPAHLVIHTQANLAQLLPRHQSLIQALQEMNRLTVVEATVTAPGLYHLGDVYVGPSRLEGIGLPLVEALACGLPLITCDNPPMNEFCDASSGALANVDRVWSRSDGYYWPQCAPNLQHLAKLMDAYASEPQLMAQRKTAARRYAEKHHNWNDRGQQLEIPFTQARLSRAEKAQAVKNALDYEYSRQGFRFTIRRQAPLLWNMAFSLREQWFR